MNYPLALLAGELSLVVMAAAAVYYPLFLLLEYLLRADAPLVICVRLRTVVTWTRITHPYLSSLISLVAAYHVYVMWMTHIFTIKMLAGLLVSAGVVVMANSGWLLKFRPHGHKVRRAHRAGMVILPLLAVIHILI